MTFCATSARQPQQGIWNRASDFLGYASDALHIVVQDDSPGAGHAICHTRISHLNDFHPVHILGRSPTPCSSNFHLCHQLIPRPSAHAIRWYPKHRHRPTNFQHSDRRARRDMYYYRTHPFVSCLFLLQNTVTSHACFVLVCPLKLGMLAIFPQRPLALPVLSCHVSPDTSALRVVRILFKLRVYSMRLSSRGRGGRDKPIKSRTQENACVRCSIN